MIRPLLLICLCIVATSSPAQRNGNEGDDEARHPMVIVDGLGDELSSRSGILLEFGMTNVRPWQLNGVLMNHNGFRQFITIGFSNNQADEAYSDDDDSYLGSDITWSLHWLLPQEKQSVAANGDQMKYRMKGWELMTSTIALNLIPDERVDFILGVGAFWGNLKLTSENVTENTGRMLYKNPFVAPMFRTELRFNFSFFSVGGRFSYRYDITNNNWKRKETGLSPLPGYQFREMQFIGYVGFRFAD